MTQPSYRDMSLHSARRERDRMFYEKQEAAAPPVQEPFAQPQTTFQPVQQQHRNEADKPPTTVTGGFLRKNRAPAEGGYRRQHVRHQTRVKAVHHMRR